MPDRIRPTPDRPELEKRLDPGFTRREMPVMVGLFNGCAVQTILGGAVIFLLIVLGNYLF